MGSEKLLVQYLKQYCSAKGYRVVDVLSDVASWLKTIRGGSPIIRKPILGLARAVY